MVLPAPWILDSFWTSYFQFCFKNVPWCSFLSSCSKSYSSPHTITLSIPNWCFLSRSHTKWFTLQISTRWLLPFSLLIIEFQTSSKIQNKNQEKSPQRSRPLAKVRAIISLRSFCFAGFHSIIIHANIQVLHVLHYIW